MLQITHEIKTFEIQIATIMSKHNEMCVAGNEREKIGSTV